MFILIHVHGYIIGYYASYKEAIEALDMSDIDTEMYEVLIQNLKKKCSHGAIQIQRSGYFI